MKHILIVFFILLILTSLYAMLRQLEYSIVEPLNTTELSANMNPRYDTNNYSMEYHDSVSVILSNPDVYGLPVDTKVATNSAGQKIVFYDPKGMTSFFYYDPKKNTRYDMQTYVPSYQDSVYLSRTYNRLPNSTTVK